MNIEKLICTEIEFDNKKYKVTGVNFEKDNIILNVEEIKEEKTTENESIKPVYSFSQTSLDKMSKVHPKLIEVMKEAIKNSPFDFRITDGARTAEEQFALYQKGRTKPGPKVTNCDGYKAK